MSKTREVDHLPTNSAKRFFDNDLQFAQAFIQQHIDDPDGLNAIDDNGNTALILAAREGQGVIVKLLLANPHVDVNAVNCYGETALSVAAVSAWPHIAKILLRHKKINVNHRDNSGDTALHSAIKLESREFVQLLLRDKRTNVNEINLHGQTALHTAILKYNENCKQNSATEFNSSAWQRGSRDAHTVVMLLFNRHSMDKNIRDNDGNTAANYDDYHAITPATAPTNSLPKKASRTRL